MLRLISMMAPTLHHDNLGRRVAHLLVALALAGPVGCRRELPPNPILENSQARLDAVEQRLRSKPAPGPTHADYLELGIARYQVWFMLNRRKAKRLERDVIDAFERAMGQSSDPLVAARAKMWLSRVYGDIPAPDRDKQIAMLKRILKEHADMDAPIAFGLGRTPHYYCNYTLAGVYQQKGERANAIDALARALVAISAIEKSGATKASYRPARLLGRLLDYEPRVVLPSYQRLLPPGTRDILRTHRATAPTRIILTVERADHSEVAVRYKVIFPGYPAIIKAWQERQKEPRVHLPDDYSRLKPGFHLSFLSLARSEGFETRDCGLAGLAPQQFTPVLAFDKNTTVTGKVLLKWSGNARLRRDVYLTAKLVRAYPGGHGPGLAADQVYVQPIRVTVEALESGRSATTMMPTTTCSIFHDGAAIMKMLM